MLQWAKAINENLNEEAPKLDTIAAQLKKIYIYEHMYMLQYYTTPYYIYITNIFLE